MSGAGIVSGAASEHVSLFVDGRELDVLTLRGDEGVSTLFRYELGCAEQHDLADPEPLLGTSAVVSVRDGYGAVRTVAGIVSEASSRVFDEGRTLVTLIVRPAAYRLRVGRDSRVVQDLDVRGIVEQVLSRAGVSARWELCETYAPRSYTQQYREDDWSFVERLLEEEGIYYWFDHESGASELVFADRSGAAPELPGGAAIDFSDETGLQTSREVVHDFGACLELTEDRHRVASFDPDRPNLSVAGDQGGGDLEIYDGRGGGPVEPAIAAARVRTRMEATKAKRGRARGASNSMRVVPGRILELGGHPDGDLDGRYFITQTRIVVAQRQREGQGPEALPPDCQFESLREAVTYRPPADTPWPRQYGLQTGVIVGPAGEEVYPDSTGRVRLQFHWDRQGARDDSAGKWMRVVQRGTAGSMLLPRMGWNVITFNEEGSVDQPIVLSRLFDAEHHPPYALPDNKTRTAFKTATTPGGGSSNEIRFEDKTGAEQMFINSTRDFNVLVQDSKTEQIKADHQRSVQMNHALDVGQNAAETVVGNATTTIGGNESETTGAGQQKTVNGDEMNVIGGGRQIETGQTLTTDVTSLRTLLVGGAQIDIALGDITANAPLVHTLVGGAAIKLTIDPMIESVGAAGTTQTIGALKFEKSVAPRTITVAGAYTETIGASLAHKTKAQYSDSAPTWSKTVGATLTGDGKTITIKGDKIDVVCGGSTIAITDSSVTVTAGSIDVSDASLTTGKPGIVNLNF
ncbi:MAG: type VI secretion system tip protein VgrG [Deltaproteobacteria bacterium]|jgi:type VI secretion system secreted protein VgrG|nr:type VI secretion system tip protein VgrG [Deltaproteobacteria bacterium]MBW2533389.1 type VI secretion system tip protein VgrG [Deltaproteobacteria bacterium]